MLYKLVASLNSNLDTDIIWISGLRHKSVKQDKGRDPAQVLLIFYFLYRWGTEYWLFGICNQRSTTLSAMSDFQYSTTFITPPIPLFSDPVCFPFHSLNVPPPGSWHHPPRPTLLYPQGVQVISLEANSSLFPWRTVPSMIFDKRCSQRILWNFKLCFSSLPIYIVGISVSVPFKTKNWKDCCSMLFVYLLYCLFLWFIYLKGIVHINEHQNTCVNVPTFADC